MSIERSSLSFKEKLRLASRNIEPSSQDINKKNLLAEPIENNKSTYVSKNANYNDNYEKPSSNEAQNSINHNVQVSRSVNNQENFTCERNESPKQSNNQTESIQQPIYSRAKNKMEDIQLKHYNAVQSEKKEEDQNEANDGKYLSFKEKLQLAQNRLMKESQPTLNASKKCSNALDEHNITTKTQENNDIHEIENKNEIEKEDSNQSNTTLEKNKTTNNMSFKEKLLLAQNKLVSESPKPNDIIQKMDSLSENKSLNKNVSILPKNELIYSSNQEKMEQINENKEKINQIWQNFGKKLMEPNITQVPIDYLYQSAITDILLLIQINFNNEEKVIEKNNEIQKEILERTTIFDQKCCAILKGSYKRFLKSVVFDIVKNICEDCPFNIISSIYQSKVKSLKNEIDNLTSFIDEIYKEKFEYSSDAEKQNYDDTKANSLFYIMSESESFKEIKVDIQCNDDVEREIPQDF